MKGKTRVIEFEILLKGEAPLLMHNSRLANPLDPMAKQVKKLTRKRNKTDEEYAELAHVEWMGGMYFDDQLGPYVPGENIARCLVDGAKLTRQGTAVSRGVFIKSDVNPLAYEKGAPRTIEGLWDKGYKHMASVVVARQRIMRCRPWFPNWAVSAIGLVDPSVLELDDISAIAESAGAMIGLGDWRPRFGRFTAEVREMT